MAEVSTQETPTFKSDVILQILILRQILGMLESVPIPLSLRSNL